MSVRGADGTTRYLAVKDKLVLGKRSLQCLCCFSQTSQNLSLPYYHDTGEDLKCIPAVVARAAQLQDSNILSPYALKNLRNIELGILSDDEGAVDWS